MLVKTHLVFLNMATSNNIKEIQSNDMMLFIYVDNIIIIGLI